MSAEWICLVAGPVIAALVQLFKGWSLVGQHPKVFAFALAAVSALVSGLTFGSLDWQAIAQCVLVPFATAVATYEVVKTAVETEVI